MRRPRILIMEDETDVLALSRKFLQPQGYRALCAKTLAKALAHIYEAPPDLRCLERRTKPIKQL